MYNLSQNFKASVSAEITLEQEHLWDIWIIPTVQMDKMKTKGKGEVEEEGNRICNGID